jgi:hypothetical protein
MVLELREPPAEVLGLTERGRRGKRGTGANLAPRIKKAPEGASRRTVPQEPYLIFVSLNSTCLRATGSYFLKASFSVFVRAFFLVT